MIEVTHHGKTIYINPTLIRSIGACQGGTKIDIPGFYPPEGFLLVQEAPHFVKKDIEEALS